MSFKRETIAIIIPTYDNLDQLVACCTSMLVTREKWPLHIIIVNNGKHILEPSFVEVKEHVTILNPGKNLGWTGGLKYGLEHAKSKYVMFANDDIFIPASSLMWLAQLVSQLANGTKIGAVGPASNVVMGAQNIFLNPHITTVFTTFLIGFCVLVKRSALKDIGGIDDSFQTGDDIDLSIRFLKKGYSLLADKSVFVYHHGFQTGKKLYGGPEKPGGWNSKKMTDDTNRHIIQKHGFKAYWLTMCKSFQEGWAKA